MANIKSQIKRNRQNDKRRLRNRVYRGAARTAVKNAHTAFEGTSPEESKKALLMAISTLDRAAAKGVLHKNNVARRKSRLMKQFARLGSAPARTEPALPAGTALEARLAAPAKARKEPARKRTAKKEPEVETKVETKAAAKSKAEAKPKAQAKPKAAPAPSSKEKKTTPKKAADKKRTTKK